jgi:HK97 family phage major capsid protein
MTTATATPQPLTRDFVVTLDREALASRAAGDERIPIAISSEVGVLRYDWGTGERYLEVLDHSPSSVDLSRAAEGLPFLVDHSTRDMVGIVEDVAVDKDRRLRGFVRFSQSQRGQDVKRDMLDGIRKSISVGYATGDKYDQTKDEKTGALTRRYREWTPYEVSSVPIPADPTVGVGRAARHARFASDVQAAVDWLTKAIALHAKHMDGSAPTTGKAGAKSQQQMMDQMQAALTALDDEASDDAMRATALAVVRRWQADWPAPLSPAPVVTVGHSADEAKEFRMSEKDTAAGAPATPALSREAVIMDQCEAAGLSVADARAFLESGKTVREVAQAIEAKRKVTVTPAPAAPTPPDYAEKGRRYNIATAIRAAASKNWKDAGYEREVSEAEAKRLGRSMNENTIFVPTVERLSEAEIEKRASLDVATSTAAGNTVFSQYGGFIEKLRNRSAIMRAGATVLPGLSGNVTFVKQDGAGTAYWIAETPGTDVTESNLTTATVSLSPKTLMARQSVSNQLLVQSSINVDAAIRDDLAKIIALEIDRAALHGSGASNQPTGVYGASGVNTVTFGGTVTYAKLVEMVAAIAADNADIGEMAFLITPETAAKAMQVARFSSTDTPLYQGTFSEGQLIGYRAFVSNQISKTLGTGSDHGILAGVMPQCLVGEWGGMSLTVDPYTLAAQDVVRLIVRSFVDIAVRNGEAFAKGATLVP